MAISNKHPTDLPKSNDTKNTSSGALWTSSSHIEEQRDTETDTAPSPSSPACHVSLTPSSPEPILAEDDEQPLWTERLDGNAFAYSLQSTLSPTSISLWTLMSNKALLHKIKLDTTSADVRSKERPSMSDEDIREALQHIQHDRGKAQAWTEPNFGDQSLVLNTTTLVPEDQPQILLEDLEPVKFHHRLSPSQTILGRGTYGVVRLMRQKSTGKLYAVKSLDRSIVASTGMESQVKLEILAQRLVSHPNTVRCYNIVTDSKHYHLILDYCSHGDLFRKLRAAPNRRLVEMDAFRLFLQLISGLLHIHSLGFCHRDLKLENLLLDEHDNLKIADFGWVARINGHSRSFNFCGTLDYLSPEMVKGTGHDYRVDLWAVGVLLYEILSGKPPFLSTRHFELIDRILFARIHEDKVASLLQSRHVKEDALDAVRSFLQPDPTKRIHFKDILKLRWVQRMLNEIYQVFLDSWKLLAPLVDQNLAVPPIADDERAEVKTDSSRRGTGSSTPVGSMLTARGLGLGPRRRTNTIRLSEHQLVGVLRGPLGSHSALNHKRYSSGGSSSPRPVTTFRHNSATGSLTRNPADPWVVRSSHDPAKTSMIELENAGRSRSGSGGDLGLQSLIRPVRLRRPLREHPFLSGTDEERKAARTAVPRATSPALRQVSPRQPRPSQWNEFTKSEDLRSSILQNTDTTSALLTRRRSSDKQLDSTRALIGRSVNTHAASSCRAALPLAHVPRRSRLAPASGSGPSTRSSAMKSDRSSVTTATMSQHASDLPLRLLPPARLPSPSSLGAMTSSNGVLLDSLRHKQSHPGSPPSGKHSREVISKGQNIAVISAWPNLSSHSEYQF